MDEYDNIIVTEVAPVHKENKHAYNCLPKSVGSCLIDMECSDWNFLEGKTVASSLQVVEYVNDVLLSKISNMSMLCFVVGSEDLNRMVMNQHALTSDGALFMISVFGFKDMMVSALDCSGLFGESFAGLTFYNDTDNDAVSRILDTIAHAFLRRSLICVDVADLKSVMGGKLSVGVRFESGFKNAVASLDAFVLRHENLIRQTTGLFVFLVLDKKVELGVDFIDSIVERLRAFVNPSAAMFFSVDYMREQVDEFSCVMVVNV
ncbi:hypothetical protein [Solidesulfovibrio magneticus]|nr:hypothetical protein [Solidesulfovibrio magneticus]